MDTLFAYIIHHRHGHGSAFLPWWTAPVAAAAFLYGVSLIFRKPDSWGGFRKGLVCLVASVFMAVVVLIPVVYWPKTYPKTEINYRFPAPGFEVITDGKVFVARFDYSKVVTGTHDTKSKAFEDTWNYWRVINERPNYEQWKVVK